MNRRALVRWGVLLDGAASSWSVSSYDLKLPSKHLQEVSAGLMTDPCELCPQDERARPAAKEAEQEDAAHPLPGQLPPAVHAT